MSHFSLNFNHGGDGTKDNPFRIPIVPYVKTPLRPLKATFTAVSDNGEPRADLFIVGIRTSGGFGVGVSNQQLQPDGRTLTGEFLFYGREQFTEPQSMIVQATKFKSKTPYGQLQRGVALLDPDFVVQNGPGYVNQYWFTTFSADEQAEYESKFAPTAEEEKPALSVSAPATKVSSLDTVLDNLDDLDLVQLKEVEELLDKRVAELKKAVEAKVESVVVEAERPATAQPDPVYAPEYQEGMGFSVLTDWISDDEFVLRVELDQVDEYGGFSSFQFDVPFIDGTEYVSTSSDGTFFDNTPENDGTYDETAVVTGWTWKAFKNERLNKVRVGGFASRTNAITSDGTLVKMHYKVTNGDVDNFTFPFVEVYFHKGSDRVNINPKNPQGVVTK